MCMRSITGPSITQTLLLLLLWTCLYTMKCRVLERKLGFLMRVMAGDTDGLSGSVLLAVCNDVESTCLVRECREMEEHFGTHFTSDIIKKEPTCNLKEMRRLSSKQTRR